MEQHMNIFLSFLLILSPLLLLLILKTKLSSRSGCHVIKYPPSPPGLPVIGNLHQLGRFSHRSLRSLSDEHGPDLMLLRLGRTPTLIVSCPEAVKEIVKNHDIIFSDRPKSTASDILFYGGRDVAFSPYGEFWRQSRKICTLELLSLKRAQSFGPVRKEEASAMVDSIRRACHNNEAVNLSEILISTLDNIASRCILGRSFRGENGGVDLGELSRRTERLLLELCVGDFVPFFGWWIDVARGFVAELKSTSRAWDGFFSRVIQEHKEVVSGGDGDSDRVRDFVDVLLGVDHGNVDMAGFTSEEYVKAIVQDMIIAGIETSSTTTEWMMAELLKNPTAMKKAQEDVRRVVGKKSNIDTDDIDRMSYFKCVVKEALRLHPPVPLLVPRETSKAVRIRGYDIPAKTRVIVNCWAIQRRGDLWDLPEEFRAERFEDSSVDLKSQESFRFIPFGFGRRMCPGVTFGMFNVEYIMANLLYWFDWKTLEPPEELDMSEVYGLTVTKKNPIYAIPTLYLP